MIKIAMESHLSHPDCVQVVVEEVPVVRQHVWIAEYPPFNAVLEFFVLESTQLPEVQWYFVILRTRPVHEAALHFLRLWNSCNPKLSIAGPSRLPLVVKLNLLV